MRRTIGFRAWNIGKRQSFLYTVGAPTDCVGEDAEDNFRGHALIEQAGAIFPNLILTMQGKTRIFEILLVFNDCRPDQCVDKTTFRLSVSVRPDKGFRPLCVILHPPRPWLFFR